jgi:exportin-1
MQDMLKSFAGSEYATQFHQTYYTLLMREVFAVMTDTFHTPGFKLHCKILLHLFGLVRTDTVIKAPLWDVAVSVLAGYDRHFCCRQLKQLYAVWLLGSSEC